MICGPYGGGFEYPLGKYSDETGLVMCAIISAFFSQRLLRLSRVLGKQSCDLPPMVVFIWV